MSDLNRLRGIVPYSKTTDSWKGTKDFGRIVCVDFDGVICEFNGWQGPNAFGKPIIGAAHTLAKLTMDGWYVCIFTTRLVTIELIDWLNEHHVLFDDINGRVVMRDRIGRNTKMPLMAHPVYDECVIKIQHYNSGNVNYSPSLPDFYWRHNPQFASIKPIASVYLDDMSWENEGKNYTEETWERIYLSLSQRFPKEK